ncbi:hypothetical protein DNI29_23480 [Hymenobacter sediminis]|uniref:ATP-binding protein n=1 Tax=Hymenobacter sediminis TaxID=2218621 RepID=UPI000DA65D92|nr:ATP-binding protein [Hymenobacter sediminis]RPD43582.1 hypothetical protein DNI29_23480 [Hymenobacter sediminis]
MKIEKLVIENFRNYKKLTEIRFDDLTTIIGKNDAGKSTILEALDIFLEGGVIKLDKSDLCNSSVEGSCVMIGASFRDLPEKIIIDSDVETSLVDEKLLNVDGFLEIRKTYKSKIQIQLCANHPINEDLYDLLSLKIGDLKKRAEQIGIDKSLYKANVSSDIRRAIRENYPHEIIYSEVLIDIDKEDTKKIYEAISNYFPLYALFQSDRKNQDKDSEIQDPMKFATKQVLKEMSAKLNDIKDEVEKKLQDIAGITLSKLKEMNPEVASHLKLEIPKELKWDSVFNFNLISDDGIPLNKRGSGVRRLVLINFFRAEAERKRKSAQQVDVIYAIEEPETAQHPDWQIKLIEALQELSSDNNSQVILTTHSPALAGMIELDNIRFVHKKEGVLCIDNGNKDNVELIAKTLGVLPALPIKPDQLKAIVCMEGPTDVDFLINISSHINVPIDLINDNRVIIIPLGGSILAYWVTNNYLRKLGIPEFHIYDRDKDYKYQKNCDEVNARGDGSYATLTKSIEIENYIHPDVVKNIFSLENPLINTREEGWHNSWMDMDIVSEVKRVKSFKETRIKSYLSDHGAKQMSNELLKALGVSEEITEWLTKIKHILDN